MHDLSPAAPPLSGADSAAQRRLVIWHSEGTAVSGLLSWMWRMKKSLPAASIDLTLASLEGALPLMVLALGILSARAGIMRTIRRGMP